MAGVQERKQMLLDDPDLSKVEPHRVFCNRCDKWLKLDETKLYAASVWRCHKNTKSHNARAPNLSASAPPPTKGEGASGTTGRQNMSASASLPSISKEKLASSDTVSPPRRAQSGDHFRLRSSDAATASAPARQSVPRLKFKVPALTRSNATPANTSPSGALPRSASASTAAAPASSASSVSATPKPKSAATTAPSLVPPTLIPAKPNASKPLRASLPLAHKVTVHPAPPLSHNASPPQSQPAGLSRPLPRVRSSSVSGKDKEVSSASASGSGPSLVPPAGRLSPHRQASYKALVSEQYIGKLEPFRAFCTLCNRWVDLSSRTPYSFGVWKGHVRKSDKHNRLKTDGAEDDSDTGSEHSHEESGVQTSSDNLANVEKPAEAGGANGVPVPSTSVSHTDSEGAPGTNGVNGKDRASESPVDNGHSPSHESLGPQQAPTPTLQFGEKPSSAGPNPFALKATTEDSFVPRRKTAIGGQPRGSQVGLLEADVLTDSSEEEAPSSSQPTHKPSVQAALEKRRDSMLADPDAAIVEARRVQCRICERWIKGSNTQEYSSHHWLKHKNKCAKARSRESERWSETVEVRKARLESDPDLATLEPHRALCRLCDKWVKLCGRSRYSASHWVQHKKKCPALQGQTGAGTGSQGTRPTTPDYESDAQAAADTADERQANASPTNTVESRRGVLLADPDILQLFPDRVQCKLCNKWIKLSMPVEYSPGHWYTHKECCPGLTSDSPSKLQAALEARKKILEDDTNIVEIEPHRVRCGPCNTWVKLRTDCSYSLGKWELHKKRCWQPRLDPASGMDLGEDAREAMDVEDVLKGESEGEDSREDTRRDGALKRTNSRAHRTDKEGDVEMACPQPESTGDVAQDADDEAEDEGCRDGSCQHTATTKQKASEDRHQKLLSDPDVLEVHPQRVLCRHCRSWVSLEDPCPYMLGHWFAHKKECSGNAVDGATSTGPLSQTAPASQPSLRRRLQKRLSGSSRPIHPLPKGKGKAVASKRPHSPMTLPPVPSRPRWPDEDERKQQFAEDPDVLRVEPHRLLCKNCNCWIRLHPIIRYSQSIWPRHKESCKQVQVLVPTDAKIRAKSEKEDARQRLLEEDPYATDLGPHRVTCKACGTNIRLDTTYKYEGSHWRAHRARCGRIPFTERLSKKRKIVEQSAPVSIAVVDSSDSDDSDASSAPRPHPTSFFTEPLVIRPTEMFKHRSRTPKPLVSELAAAAAKAQAEADLNSHLESLAMELDESGRFSTLLQLAGDGTTSEELAQRQYAATQVEEDDAEFLGEEGVLTSRRSPTPDPETWIPSKRTREEEEDFDVFFRQRPLPPTPPRSKSKTRMCKLGKEAMQVVD